MRRSRAEGGEEAKASRALYRSPTGLSGGLGPAAARTGRAPYPPRNAWALRSLFWETSGLDVFLTSLTRR